MITPHKLSLYESSMVEIYQTLEIELIKKIIEEIQDTGDVLSWQARKLSELRALTQSTLKEIEKATGLAEERLNEIMTQYGDELIKDIDEQIPYDPKPKPTNLDSIMESYKNQTWLDIDNLVNQTLVTTNYGQNPVTQAYTNVLNRTSALFNTGIYTLEEAVEKSIIELSRKGIMSSFIDKGGHRWSIESYVRTVMRSTLANTYNEVRTERMAEYGIHTVVVTSHAGAREACTRIQGNVVDLRPVEEADGEYKSIYDPSWQADYGEPGGHRGVNCRHLHIPFVPGVNENNQPKIDDETNKEVREAMAKQRYLERQLVQAEKTRIVYDALGNKEKAALWGGKVDQYDAKLEELVNSSQYLSRNLEREKVYMV